MAISGVKTLASAREGEGGELMATHSTGQQVSIPLAAIASGRNPRRVFDRLALDELAQSIKAHGILQPILVRRANGTGTYELVSGERRLRAARTAGLLEIPAVVLELGDAEVLEVQLVENLQRDDLHPLEEAEGYEQLLKLRDRGRAPEDVSARPVTVEDLAATVGKSTGYVYGRLKLRALVPEARKAFLEGKVGLRTALLIARIPVPELQKEATREITQWGPEGMPAARASSFVQENYMLRLADAPWPTADAQLVPEAGACTVCPKRTGNQRELFSDVKSPDVCTDPKCFGEKKAAWTAKVRAEAEASGRTVIAGKAAKAVKPHEYSEELKGYVDLSKSCYDDPKGRTYQALLGKHAEKAALLEDPHTKELRTVMPAADVTKALKEKGYAFAERRRAASTNPARAGERKREQQARLEREVRRRIHEELRAKVRSLSREDLALVATAFYLDIWDENRKRIVQLWGWEEKEKRNRGTKDVGEQEIPKLSEAELRQLLLDLALVGETYVSSWDSSKPERLLATAKRYGVDAARIRKAVVAEAAKAKAAKTKKAKPAPDASKKAPKKRAK